MQRAITERIKIKYWYWGRVEVGRMVESLIYFKGNAKGFSDRLDVGCEIKNEDKGNWITPKFCLFFDDPIAK